MVAKEQITIQQSIEQQVDDLLKKMTLKDKIAILSGRDSWYTVPLKHLGIPSIVMTDGPHGVRAVNPEMGRVVGVTTCFPTGVSMAASWNPELVERVGQALGEETRGMDCDILLGPCVNIIRYPLGGRNFESYSEDPYLAGRTAVAYVKGVQSRGVGTSVKHFAANNYEIERGRASSIVDERTLREIYLPAFEAAVKEAQPWTVMCSYNRINGVYASQNHHLLTEILKEEWGFEGLVVSDWGANHEIYESIRGGLDLEMPGPAHYYGSWLVQAVQNWQIDESAIDKAARRVLKVILLTGRMNNRVSKGAVNTPEHQALARKLAEEAITLLKNESNLLPLDMTKIKSIAVIGPDAAEAVIEGGGSSHVDPPYRVSPLEALRDRLDGKVKIEYEQGCDNFDEPPAIKTEWLTRPNGSHGSQAEFYTTADLSGAPRDTTSPVGLGFWWHISASKYASQDFSARWRTTLTVPEGGLYWFKLNHSGKMRVILDGEVILESQAPDEVKHEDSQIQASVYRQLNASQAYLLTVEYVRYPGQEMVNYHLGLSLSYPAGKDGRLQKAVTLAKQSDIVLLFVGMPEGFETEGWDRANMKLPGRQDELIYNVAMANRKTVVVFNAGAPVEMPWIDEVSTLIEAYYPGQENGNAIARVLLGEVNPSGKLPVTFPIRLEDSPAHINSAYPGAREVKYGEGIFVGYRYFDAKGIVPSFPFGYGLSYTTFEYTNLVVKSSDMPGILAEANVTVKNSGKLAGKEVVQLYIHDLQSALPRPPKELKGFIKVPLQPGESKTLTFNLDERAFAYYDPCQMKWVAEAGDFEVLVGASSKDIRQKTIYQLKTE